MFNYWDRSYDVQRVVQSTEYDDGYYTKESTLDLEDYGVMHGLYSYFTYDILKIMNFLVGYQDLMKDNDSYKSFTSSININPNLIPKVKKF